MSCPPLFRQRKPTRTPKQQPSHPKTTLTLTPQKQPSLPHTYPNNIHHTSHYETPTPTYPLRHSHTQPEPHSHSHSPRRSDAPRLLLGRLLRQPLDKAREAGRRTRPLLRPHLGTQLRLLLQQQQHGLHAPLLLGPELILRHRSRTPLHDLQLQAARSRHRSRHRHQPPQY